MARLFRLSSPRRLRCLLFILLLAVAAGPGAIGAATLLVTTTADNGAGSLRAGVAAAADGDNIQFDAALNGQTISLTGGELVIDKNITINGPGPRSALGIESFNRAVPHLQYPIPATPSP